MEFRKIKVEGEKCLHGNDPQKCKECEEDRKIALEMNKIAEAIKEDKVFESIRKNREVASIKSLQEITLELNRQKIKVSKELVTVEEKYKEELNKLMKSYPPPDKTYRTNPFFKEEYENYLNYLRTLKDWPAVGALGSRRLNLLERRQEIQDDITEILAVLRKRFGVDQK